MSLISSSIPNFVNGVSQQPSTLRLASQATEQINGLSTASSGLQKRPPSQHMQTLQAVTRECFVHPIERDAKEKYFVVIESGLLKVYDIDGTAMTVNTPNGLTYLDLPSASTNPNESFAAVSIADFTFIANKTKTVAQRTDTHPPQDFQAVVVVNAGNYGKTYRIYLDGAVKAEFATPDGGASAHSTQITTEYIAQKLYENLTSNLLTDTAYTHARYANQIHIKRTDRTFGIAVEDGFNGHAMRVIKDVVTDLSKLPSDVRVIGQSVEVSSSADTAADNYWVKSFGGSGTGGVAGGYWKESVKPGELMGLNAATMPHVLIRNADGTFTFKQYAWTDRMRGDRYTNPNPSFVDRKINDIFFYRNRLGLLADENVIFSEAGEYFNFYRTTITQLVDSDPIDVSVSHTKVSILKTAIPWNKELLLFSDHSQFVVEAGDLLTPKTISVKLATEYPMNGVASPVPVGNQVYFAVGRGRFSSVREYYVDVNNSQNTAMDITAHIPSYIPANIFQITASANDDIMVMLSLDNRRMVYVYKWYSANGEKLLSSWSTWDLGDDAIIYGAQIIGSELFLILRRGTPTSTVMLEKIALSKTALWPEEPFAVHLDRKKLVVGSALTYDAVTNKTTIDRSFVGYTPQLNERLQMVVANGQSKTAGTLADAYFDGTNLTVTGNFGGCQIIIGKPYTFTYKMSPIMVRQGVDGGGSKSDTEGRLQLRKVAFNYENTGGFTVKVTPLKRPTYSYTFNGNTLGVSTALGLVNTPSGRFSVPVMSKNDTTDIVIENSTPMPLSLLSADWEGFYVKRSQAT